MKLTIIILLTIWATGFVFTLPVLIFFTMLGGGRTEDFLTAIAQAVLWPIVIPLFLCGVIR